MPSVEVDAPLVATGFDEVPAAARAIEEAGYDGAYTFEGPHDPFFPLLLAAEHTRDIRLTTAVAIAFARNPMLLAGIGYDLQLASHGRFVLGLGSQIAPHVTKRFSMPWSRPAARMRELVLAIRAIWARWHEGVELDFRGEFYTHTLMTPFFDPGESPYGLPRIFLAGVGPRMTEVAGEVADGFIVHPFSTERYLREHTIPALEAGTARAGRSRDDLEIAFPLMIVCGERDEELERARAAVRGQLAFYGSTPAYRPVLEAHGWGDLQPELHARSKQGDWAGMADLVDEEMVATFAVEGPPDAIAPRVLERYGDIVSRVSFNAPYRADGELWQGVLDGFRTGGRSV